MVNLYMCLGTFLGGASEAPPHGSLNIFEPMAVRVNWLLPKGVVRIAHCSGRSHLLFNRAEIFDDFYQQNQDPTICRTDPIGE